MPEDHMDPTVPPTPLVTDEWGLPVLPPPSWLPPEDPVDEMGYCAGQDAEDNWDA